MLQLTLAEEGIDLLFGTRDENLRRVESAFAVEVSARGNQVSISGDPAAEAAAGSLLGQLSELLAGGYRLRNEDVATAIRVLSEDPNVSLASFFNPGGGAAAAQAGLRGQIAPRSLNQQHYLKAITEHDMVISVGPAGTGKTYLAVAMAAAALVDKQVKRLVLARPAVEAGEKLGFLPGDLAEKVNPYLRPLHDALHDLLGFEKVARMMERGMIEVAPLAFMRGRTLNDSFVILDEAQNTTTEQMKMFLTRIGFHSKAVITGDITQIDLPRNQTSGLKEALEVLRDVPGIGFCFFDERDVVRHPLVQKIVGAYDRHARRAEVAG
ncbi:MAG: PhoH family protein [Thermoanaerobaculia bacterium]|jgi:phosphate starvation-inducible PhoH-like protein|nr:MAG: PhoH family protein [Thermoanaerobaculia bacterium]MBZ0100985.1 PhoH family protein [Thermoanaerobaculia bacterium]